uniref:Erythroid membrane-associated protein-like n=1 Tax=Fundulus heteroclitus TaxID=8078 RepID=A0A3Q2P368_FUNHE
MSSRWNEKPFACHRSRECPQSAAHLLANVRLSRSELDKNPRSKVGNITLIYALDYMLFVVRADPVVLDPATASPWLELSPDLTSMKESPERLVVPDNRERFDPIVFVMGAEGYKTGKYKWDVTVGDNPKWVLGVCRGDVARKKKFTVSPSRGVWAIGLSKGVYTAHSDERADLNVTHVLEKIRIKLNMDKGEVSFWDGGREKHLITFTHNFDTRIFPIFGPGLHSTPMVLAPGKIAVHTS